MVEQIDWLPHVTAYEKTGNLEEYRGWIRNYGDLVALAGSRSLKDKQRILSPVLNHPGELMRILGARPSPFDNKVLLPPDVDGFIMLAKHFPEHKATWFAPILKDPGLLKEMSVTRGQLSKLAEAYPEYPELKQYDLGRVDAVGKAIEALTVKTASSEWKARQQFSSFFSNTSGNHAPRPNATPFARKY